MPAFALSESDVLASWRSLIVREMAEQLLDHARLYPSDCKLTDAAVVENHRCRRRVLITAAERREWRTVRQRRAGSAAWCFRIIELEVATRNLSFAQWRKLAMVWRSLRAGGSLALPFTSRPICIIGRRFVLSG